MTNYLAPDRPTLAITTPAWHEEAACRRIVADDLWFPTTTANARVAVKEAKRVCGMCDVRTACLNAAIKGYEKGIWAGTTEDERLEMRRRAS